MDNNFNKLSNQSKVAGTYSQVSYLDDVKPKNRPDLYKMLNKQIEEKKKDRSLTIKTFGSASVLVILILAGTYFLQ
tara:strand:- start:103 stop:330 length:228 start_codon:yes stop_codon:yes gene_type:complete